MSLNLFYSIKAICLPSRHQNLYLDNGFLSNGHFIVSVAWLESLPNAKQIMADLQKHLDAAQTRDVTAKVQGQSVQSAPKPLEQIVRDVKLKFYKTISRQTLERATPVIEFDDNPNPGNSRDLDIPWTESAQAMAFKVQGHPIKIEINVNYWSLLFADDKAIVMAKQYDRPIAIVKNGATVAVIQPMQSIATNNYESKMEAKNAKLKNN